jgi:hypothetical protein
MLGIRFPEDVAASLTLDEEAVRELAHGAPINRDGFNRLQSRSGRLGTDTLMLRMDELIAPVDPLVRARPPGIDVYRLLRIMSPERARRIAASLPDPVDRAVAEAVAEIADGKRLGPRRRLEDALAQQPDHIQGRAALLRMSAGTIADGADPEKILRPPISEPERTLVEGWRARARDPKGEALRELEARLAAIPPLHPLGDDALRLRVQARIQSGDPALVKEAIDLANASLGDRPDPAAILLRAEAYSAAGDHVAVLETIGDLVDHLSRQHGASRAFARRALALARATPGDDEEIFWLRRNTLRRLGVGVDGRPLRRQGA